MKLTKQTYDENTETTHISGSFKVKKIIFEDDNNTEQVISFNQSLKDKINDNETKLSNIIYDEGLNKTTLNNSTHINSLTCGNFNTSHLSGTTSNIQTQINNLSLKTIDENNKLNTNLIADGSITNAEFQLLSGVSSNIQNQLENLSIETNKISNLEDVTKHLSSDETATYNLSNNFFSYNMELGLSGNISFYPDIYNSETPEIQNFGFTNARKDKLENTTLINSENKLNASLIADGTISNAEFQSLNNITGNIQEQINTLKTASSLTNTGSVSIIPFGLNNQGTWYQGTYTRTLTSFLQSGLHSFNLMITVSNVNELLKMLSKIQIQSMSSLVDESLYCGINLDSSTSNEKSFHTNLQYIYYIPPSLHEQLYISVFTDYHYKANSGFTANCKYQIAKLS